MSEELQGYLLSEIETLRSTVFRAGALNARTLGPCAEIHIGTVRNCLPASPDLEEATFQALSRVAAMARRLYTQAQVAEIEEARRHALAAIDAFAAVVEAAACVSAGEQAGRAAAVGSPA